MIPTFLILVPFAVSILILVQYVYTKKSKYRKRFIVTALAGCLLLCLILFLSLFNPRIKEAMDFQVMIWLLSGYLMITAICIKILVFSRIYTRYQDPVNFHYNFFGKKVVHSGFMTNKEMREFMMTIPAFLFAGAYFVARLINLIIYGHLAVVFIFNKYL